VTSRVRAALNEEDVVEQLRARAAMEGVTNPLEVWYDPRTGDQRTAETETQQERGTRLTADRRVFTAVDHAARTWERTEFPQVPEDRAGDVMGAPTPGEVRELLADSGSPWKLVGHEAGTLHLRQAHVDVWVDDATYRPTRMVTVKEAKATVESTFTWLPRTSANLTRVAVRVPDGYRRVAPRAEGPAAH
jgi:hypothetical protein